MKKSLSLLLALCLLLALALPAAAAEVPAPITTIAEAANISKYGNVRLALTNEEIKAAGYVFGDVVTVEFLDYSLDLPFCRNFSDVDSGTPALYALDAETQVYAAINMGSFAASYGIAEKTVHDDGTYTWSYCAGVEGPVSFTISMKEPGGYYDEYVMHQLSYTNDRADYPQLTDAQFANFRAVTTSGMGKNILYRTASPVNPEKGRNTYADAAIRDAGVTVVMNLVDDPVGIKALGGYEGSYYATTEYIALSMDMDFSTAAFEAQLAEGLRFLAAHPGVYAVHCLEGKDRAGFVSAILECLMGATYDEIIADYMTSFYNYYGVTADDPRYAAIADGNIVKSLSRAFGVADLRSADLAAEAAEYMRSIGLTDAQLAALKTNLSVSRPFTDVAADAWYAGAVGCVYENGLMNGTGDGHFSPEGLLTRAQLVTILWRLAGSPVVNHILPADVAADAWYASAARWAAAQSPSDTAAFHPDEALSREDAALLLWYEARYLGADVSVGEDTNILSYNDAFDISEGKAAAMQWAVGAGVIEGTPEGDLLPHATLTRAQAAAMLQRLETALGGEKEIWGRYQGIDVASPEWVGALDAAKDADQLLIVAGFSEDATDAWVSLHEKRSDGSWRMVMTTPGFIGKSGLGKTREGDAKTPTGVYRFNRAFGIADDPGCAIPYVKVDEDTYWSGDVREGYHYNELVSLKDLPGLDLESGDSEHIIDYPYHYQYCLNISYNEAGTPGLGSAIFLHCFGPAKPFTGGCVAIPEEQMCFVMQKIDAETVVVIDTYEALSGGAGWPDSTWPQER